MDSLQEFFEALRADSSTLIFYGSISLVGLAIFIAIMVKVFRR